MGNDQRKLPFSTLFFSIFLILVGIWFFSGESFRLYGSLFFSLYHIFNNSWVAIILVAVVQNVAFLPLRFLGELTWPKMKAFEEELEEQKSKEEQSFLLKKKVHSGEWPVVIYTINFILLLVAFISAGRFFLLEFYSEAHKIDASKYFYSWVPYPEYPLSGIQFPFPWVKVLASTAISWTNIFLVWIVIFSLMFVPRILWKWIRNATGFRPAVMVNLRIRLNRVHFWLIGIVGTLFIVSLYFLRNIPTWIEPVMLYADISKQNTAFNIVTSVATFIATIFIGEKHHSEEKDTALKAGYDPGLVEKVHKEKSRETLRNAFLIATTAYFLTHLMPSSHDLSVLSFEAVYILASYTIDPILKRKASAMQKLVGSNSVDNVSQVVN